MIYAWVLIFNYTMNGGWTSINGIASEEACLALAAQIDAPKAHCYRYEMAIPPSHPQPVAPVQQ